MRLWGCILFCNTAGIPDTDRKQRAFGKSWWQPLLQDTGLQSHIMQHEKMRCSVSKCSPQLRASAMALLLQDQPLSPGAFSQFCLHPLSSGPAWRTPAPGAAVGRSAPCCQPSWKLHCSLRGSGMHRTQTSERLVWLLNLSSHVKSPARSIERSPRHAPKECLNPLAAPSMENWRNKESTLVHLWGFTMSSLAPAL